MPDIAAPSPGDKAQIALVLFDCDGTLIESEVLMYAVKAERISQMGVPYTGSALASRYTGLSYAIMVADLAEKHGLVIDDATTHAIEDDFLRRIGSELLAIDGAKELLEAMPVAYCIASNAPGGRLIHMLRATSLLDLFGTRVVSAHDAGRPKPDPAVFLLASELMGVPPAACLVVEDSLSGLLAARAAGMRVAVYLGGEHQTEAMIAAVRAARPDLELQKLPDLLPYIRAHMEH